MTDLFKPLRLAAHDISNRIVMAPMTRSRADEHGRIGDLAPTYYAQRAQAGLIISEGIFPSFMGKGYVRTPGLVTDEHVRAFRKVTDAVHAKGGKIFAQIMHVGRISLPTFLPALATPIAPSAVRPSGGSYTDQGMQPFVTPRALPLHEIPSVIEEYRAGTERAFAAGFDGVELHGASGYLPEQFLSSGTNLRTDGYGGSIAGRARFILEVFQAMAAVRGPEFVGVKVAPELGFNDIHDDHPEKTYTHLARALSELRPAYLHVVSSPHVRNYHALLRPLFQGPYLAAGGFSRASAIQMLKEQAADAIVFGSLFVANPDLPERLRNDAPLAEVDRETLYTPGPRGYIDYPTLALRGHGLERAS